MVVEKEERSERVDDSRRERELASANMEMNSSCR